MDLCNYSANSWFEIILLLTARPWNLFAGVVQVLSIEDFISKKLQIIEIKPLWCPHYFEFSAISNDLRCNILSEAIPLGKS